MSKSKHTPGTWRIEDTSIVTDDVCIAVIETDGGYEAPFKQQQANAQLISAAPDLLTALEVFATERILRGTDHDKAVAQARAAIAKCKGE